MLSIRAIYCAVIIFSFFCLKIRTLEIFITWLKKSWFKPHRKPHFHSVFKDFLAQQLQLWAAHPGGAANERKIKKKKAEANLKLPLKTKYVIVALTLIVVLTGLLTAMTTSPQNPTALPTESLEEYGAWVCPKSTNQLKRGLAKLGLNKVVKE